jgi:hypothetical protein
MTADATAPPPRAATRGGPPADPWRDVVLPYCLLPMLLTVAVLGVPLLYAAMQLRAAGRRLARRAV